jgi:RHS repeat-associated protein
MGKVIKVSQPHAPGVTPIWTVYTYDALGRTLTITKPDNSITRYDYTGNTTKVTDAKGNWKLFTTDALGNLVQVTEPDPQLGNVNTNYSYNLMNKLIQVQMTRGTTTQTRTFTYDQYGQGARLMSATNPENGTVSYTYNPDGTLATRRDAKNQLVQYTYDGYERLIQVSRPDGTHDNYTYDAYSTTGFSSQNAWGRLAALTFQGQPDPNNPNSGTTFTYMYSYKTSGLVTAKHLRLTRGSASADLEADYTWDEEGRMTSLRYPGTGLNQSTAGPLYSYAYDTMGRLSSMSQTDGPAYHGPAGNFSLPMSIVTGVTYGVADELLGISGNGNSGYMGETRTYNSLLQLLTVSEPGLFGDPGVQIQYTYPDGNNIGKIAKQKNLVSGEEVQYQYDSLGRMISAQTTVASVGTPWGYGYQYDGFGNLIAKNVTLGSPSAGWALSADGNNHIFGYYYDANGNFLGANNQGTVYTYDVENRLTQYVPSDQPERYGYDPSNKRIQKQPAGGAAEEIHFYGAAGERLGIYALNGLNNALYFSVKTLNIYFGGKRLGRVSDSGSTSFVAVDRLGSEGASNLYPWGEEKTTSSTQNTERFATYYRDQATGLDYADQRYYSSIMGRFLTPDPYRATATSPSDPGHPQSWNRYAYALNDPVNYFDPTGQQADEGDAPWTPVTFNFGPLGLLTALPPFMDKNTNQFARGLLDQRLKDFRNSNCAKILKHEGIDTDKLTDTSKVRFYNVSPDSKYANVSASYIAGNNFKGTLLDNLTFGADASTLRGTNVVLLGENFFGINLNQLTPNQLADFRSNQQNILLHEELHALFPSATDSFFFNDAYFRQNGLDDTDYRQYGNTSAITDWLARDCQKK